MGSLTSAIAHRTGEYNCGLAEKCNQGDISLLTFESEQNDTLTKIV